MTYLCIYVLIIFRKPYPGLKGQGMRNIKSDQELLVEYTFELGELPNKVALNKLQLRVVNGVNTVLNRRTKKIAEIEKTGVQRKLQTSTSIGLIAFDNVVGVSAAMNRNIHDIREMVVSMGGKAQLTFPPFLFEGRRHTEVRIEVGGFDTIDKRMLVKKYSRFTSKSREYARG